MKRKYGNRMPGIYKQDKIESEYFNGYLCYTKLKDIDEPLMVNNGLYDLCIIKNDYEWYQLFSLDKNYVLTIMIDDNKKVIQWYFDISYKIGLDNGVPYEDDMYLDMIITKEGNILHLYEHELIEAHIINSQNQFRKIKFPLNHLYLLTNNYETEDREMILNRIKKIKYITKKMSITK